MLRKMEFLHPENPENEIGYLRPRITLEPISTARSFDVIEHEGNYDLNPILNKLLPGACVTFYESARAALRVAMDAYKEENLSVWIIETPSSSGYLSRCVDSIIQERTDGGLLYVTDFGHWNSDDLPIHGVIDDAWSFQPSLIREAINLNSVYVTSLTKIIGTSFGGITVSAITEDRAPNILNSNLEVAHYRFLKTQLAEFLTNFECYKKKRNENVSQILSTLSASSFNELKPGKFNEFRGPLLLRVAKEFNEYETKIKLHNLGVRGTSFFGNQTLVLPCHQDLSDSDIKYISKVVADILN